MTPIQLDNLVKQNIVKTGGMGEVTWASCLSTKHTQANCGNSVWVPHPQGSMVDRT